MVIAPLHHALEALLDKDILDHLKALHTSEIDARNGYEKALEDAEGKGMSPLFHDMIALHDDNAAELEGELVKAGEQPDENGSFMTLVHQTIMNVRSLFGGLDGSVLPGLIDGETRNVGKYDNAIKEASGLPAIVSLLSAQRSKIQEMIAVMETQKAA